MIDTAIAALGLGLGLIVAIASWISARRSELRRDHVLTWANAAIDCLQTLALLAKPELLSLDHNTRVTKIEEIGIRLSVLTEQGRLLFKNLPAGSFGKHKEPAYRGVRPLVLDELVIAHQLACQWRSLREVDRDWAFEISVSLIKRFVSLAQLEVGRNKTASIYTKAGGDGTSFQVLLNEHHSGHPRRRPSIDGEV